jgi:hypothetical protein
MATTLARGHAPEKEKREKPWSVGKGAESFVGATIRSRIVGKGAESFAPVTIRSRTVGDPKER